MLGVWMTCPLQARFQYVDQLPREINAKTAFGSCIHHALHVYNTTNDVEEAVKEFRRVWNEPESIGAAFTYWPKYTSFGGLMNAGCEILREYDAKLQWEKRRVLGTEHKFLVPFGAHEITGFVDLLETKKSKRGIETLRVIDYKSHSKQPFSPQLRVNIQFTAYVYASMQPEFWLGNGPDFPAMPNGEFYWETHKDMPRRAIWYHLMTNKEVDAGDRDDNDFMRLYRVACEVERALDHEVFVPNISGDSCTFCSYTDPCGLHIPTEEELRDQETAF